MNDVNANGVHVDEMPVFSECPAVEDIGGFVERRLPDSRMAAVAEHVATCSECQEKVADFAGWLADGQDLDVDAASLPEDRDAVRKAMAAVDVRRGAELWRRLFDAFGNGTRECLAAADGQTADQMQRDNAMVGELHFVSIPSTPRKDAWHAKATLPASASDEACIRFQVFDGDDRAMSSGVLRFCDVDLGVEEGYAFMSMGEFRRNLRIPMVWFRHGDGNPVEGVFSAAYGI